MIRYSGARLDVSAPPRPLVSRRGDTAWLTQPRIAPQPLTETEAKPGYGRRSYWFALATIVVFAAGFLQFGLLDVWATPASERVNNGRHATFFAVHINPYYVFSEDFHLYAVRAKRVLDRGWTDSPLASHANERKNYSAPLQAALGMIAVATDGQPVPYAIFIATVVSLAWCAMFVAARRWLPVEISTRSILGAVLVTVLFESMSGIFTRQLDYAQWPVHRGLRMSTMAWTSPLVLAVALAATSLLFERKRVVSTIAWVGILLAALAASDNWALIVAFATTGIVATVLGVNTIIAWYRRDAVRTVFGAGIGLCGAMLFAGLLHWSLAGALTGDALTRGGVGTAWREVPLPPGEPAYFDTVRGYEKLLLLLTIAACVVIKFGRQGASPLPWTSVSLARPGRLRTRMIVIAAIPMLALLVMLPVLTQVVGIERYHIFQFIWRVEYCVVFATILAACEVVKLAIRRCISTQKIVWRCEVAAIGVLAGSLFGYHQFRVYQFVSQTAAREFFLTEDEEGLRDWLRSLPGSEARTLATASHELNYLCAYWTNADLLLPEGFPYHNAESNAQIEERTADLLRIYGTRPETWTNFNLHGHSDDQWSWHSSRLRSAREGYSYYLMHRSMSVEGYENPYEWAAAPLANAKGTTARIAEKNARLQRGRKLAATLDYGRPVAAIGMVERVAAKLAQDKPNQRPDVIIVDEVSRALGNAALSGYRRAFAHGTIEAWVRSDTNRNDWSLDNKPAVAPLRGVAVK